ncbi:MAG: hypothetical protein Q8O19_05505, partial [Rectinemataceae bacterium]|nr:hypothetical protein [Rectinemataceae bacterium]
ALKDLTDVVTITGDTSEPAKTPVAKPAKGGDPLPALAPVKEDHPGIALLDIAIEESVRYCEKEGYPAPNLSLWHNFSRGFLNKSLWHYFPSGAEPESPAICALIGIAGLAVCYTPVIIAFYEKKQKEGKNAEQKKIAEHNRKTAELRAERRARGEDPNTGEPMISPPPGYSQEQPEQPDEPEPEIPQAPAAKNPEWFMTTAQPVPVIARKIEAAEPPAPGMG